MKVGELELDLVNLRSETYADSRIPEIGIGTPEQDALRRDLTINSLFYNINTGQVCGAARPACLACMLAHTQVHAASAFTKG